jgi:hypothetical protein
MIILSVRIKFIPFKGDTKTGISSRKSLAPSPRGQRAHHVKCVAFAWRVIFQNRLGLKKQVCACLYIYMSVVKNIGNIYCYSSWWFQTL